MKATPKQLLAQLLAVQGKDWMPYFGSAAKTGKTSVAHMLAIGSRETNLKNIKGDFRNGKWNGFGPLQVDVGTDPNFARNWSPSNARAGIERGGEIYLEKVKDTKNCVGKTVKVRSKSFVGKQVEPDDLRRIATAAYNCGRWAHYHFSNNQHIDSTTSKADYSRDVYDRAIHFAAMLEGFVIETKTVKKKTVCRLIKDVTLAVIDDNALEAEIKLQGKYCRPEHAALYGFDQETRESLPLGLPEATQTELQEVDYNRNIEDLPEEDNTALEPVEPIQPPVIGEQNNGIILNGATGTVVHGDAADKQPSRFFDVENLKPFVKKWLTRIGIGFPSFSVAQFSTLTGIGAKLGGDYFWVLIALAVIIFLITLAVALVSTCILIGILWVNRKEIVHYKTLSFESMKDPESYNVGLNFVHKGLKPKPEKCND